MTKRAKIYLLVAVIFIFVFNVAFGLFLMQRNAKPASENPSATSSKGGQAGQAIKQIENNSFSYKGEEGKDGLTLLKEKTKIEQSSSGLVTSINGRKADEGKKEFWAFFVNGKMAEVGPADYQTKAGDLIEWKIQKY